METDVVFGRMKPGESTAIALLARVLKRFSSARAQRHLRLAEMVALGEKRFVAVVQFERERFLIGGTTTSVTLLASLSPEGPAAVLSARGQECGGA
jgi:flagellar biogenesis protein FliO